jgi:hypothetical protein
VEAGLVDDLSAVTDRNLSDLFAGVEEAMIDDIEQDWTCPGCDSTDCHCYCAKSDCYCQDDVDENVGEEE